MPVLRDGWDPELPDTETVYKPAFAAIAERNWGGGSPGEFTGHQGGITSPLNFIFFSSIFFSFNFSLEEVINCYTSRNSLS